MNVAFWNLKLEILQVWCYWSFTSKIYVYPQQIAYGKNKYSENGLYEAVFAYVFKMFRYMHDKENIFVSLVKSALNI